METNWLMDQMESALDHAERLWPFNAIAIEDPEIETAVLCAIRYVQLHHNDQGYPGVRVIYPNTDGLGYHADLVQGTEWIASPHYHRAFTGWCGRCADKKRTHRILYVPAGMSIVGIELCGGCSEHIITNYSPLMWMERT